MSKIEWTDCTWNPVRGCSRVSEGCRNCYAERVAARFSGVNVEGSVQHRWGDESAQPFRGFAEMRDGAPRWTGRVELVPEKLTEPLRWRKPRRVFVNSMSDLFHESLPDEAIDRVFAVMALAQRHTFQVLTKRPERMRAYMLRLTRSPGCADQISAAARAMGHAVSFAWPLPNVWLGVSVEDQKTADERIQALLSTPAALRFVSYEPALGAVDFEQWMHDSNCNDSEAPFCICGPPREVALDWIIVGGESGPGARPFDVAWARSTIAQCKAAGVACFVKQLGALPVLGDGTAKRLTAISRSKSGRADGALTDDGGTPRLFDRVALHDRKGGDPSEWPEDLRVREFPERSP